MGIDGYNLVLHRMGSGDIVVSRRASFVFVIKHPLQMKKLIILLL